MKEKVLRINTPDEDAFVGSVFNRRLIEVVKDSEPTTIVGNLKKLSYQQKKQHLCTDYYEVLKYIELFQKRCTIVNHDLSILLGKKFGRTNSIKRLYKCRRNLAEVDEIPITDSMYSALLHANRNTSSSDQIFYFNQDTNEIEIFDSRIHKGASTHLPQKFSCSEEVANLIKGVNLIIIQTYFCSLTSLSENEMKIANRYHPFWLAYFLSSEYVTAFNHALSLCFQNPNKNIIYINELTNGYIDEELVEKLIQKNQHLKELSELPYDKRPRSRWAYKLGRTFNSDIPNNNSDIPNKFSLLVKDVEDFYNLMKALFESINNIYFNVNNKPSYFCLIALILSNKKFRQFFFDLDYHYYIESVKSEKVYEVFVGKEEVFDFDLFTFGETMNSPQIYAETTTCDEDECIMLPATYDEKRNDIAFPYTPAATKWVEEVRATSFDELFTYKIEFDNPVYHEKLQHFNNYVMEIGLLDGHYFSFEMEAVLKKHMNRLFIQKYYLEIAEMNLPACNKTCLTSKQP